MNEDDCGFAAFLIYLTLAAFGICYGLWFLIK